MSTPQPSQNPAVEGSSTEEQSSSVFLESVEGEISFFRSIMHARPIGMHRHFHVLSMRSHIHKDTGRWVSIEDIWEKLRMCYDLEALDGIDIEAEGYETPQTSKGTPISIQSPSPSENLANHPFFREEYSLPFEPSFETIVSERRMRNTPSVPSSPERSPAPSTTGTGLGAGGTSGRAGRQKVSRRRAVATTTGRSRANMAGLVGGDSDSSALTQESGDEGIPTGSTATDGETIDGEEEERDQTPDTLTTKTGRARKTTKKAQTQNQTQSSRARPPPNAGGSSSRPTKKRKR
ncbi:hypothetical protein K435DRAFT_772618 [Dendrothele bispora CBS 962.96]|uniref:Chromatin modification-related protein EAF7 n=1 Tax=Dendrothele bispora (strain CBS 962.96) TaxID=1314807 RepID=A0A4S8MVC6_DENBC|nr:hypothetical protein K435DRAFT_772618 [Dendrothele bispora CBS 962.96]